MNQNINQLNEREKNALEICNSKIAEYKLDIILKDVKYESDNIKIFFYFTKRENERVDFRNFAIDLAAAFKMPIELRQVECQHGQIIQIEQEKVKE